MVHTWSWLLSSVEYFGMSATVLRVQLTHRRLFIYDSWAYITACFTPVFRIQANQCHLDLLSLQNATLCTVLPQAYSSDARKGLLWVQPWWRILQCTVTYFGGNWVPDWFSTAKERNLIASGSSTRIVIFEFSSKSWCTRKGFFDFKFLGWATYAMYLLTSRTVEAYSANLMSETIAAQNNRIHSFLSFISLSFARSPACTSSILLPALQKTAIKLPDTVKLTVSTIIDKRINLAIAFQGKRCTDFYITA